MGSLNLLAIAARVAGLPHVSKLIEVPYAKGVDMWKLQQKGKLPSATKDAVREIVQGHGGKNPKYEEDGLFFDVPDDKADSAVEDIEHLHGIDKAFKKLFDKGGILQRTTPKERKVPEKKPSRAEKKADKLLSQVPDGPDELPAEEAPAEEAPKPAKKTPVKQESAPRAEKPKAAPKPKAEPAPAPGKAKGKRRVFNPRETPDPIPASHQDVLQSVDNLRRTLKTDDEEAFMESVKKFLETINYEAWA